MKCNSLLFQWLWDFLWNSAISGSSENGNGLKEDLSIDKISGNVYVHKETHLTPWPKARSSQTKEGPFGQFKPKLNYYGFKKKKKN